MDDELSLRIVLICIVVVSLLLPTLGLFALERARPGRRPQGDRIAAWCCLYLGQLVVPLAGASWACLALGRDWLTRGAWPQAIAYGIMMAAALAFVGVETLRCSLLAPRVLHADARVRPIAKRVARRATLGLVLIGALGLVLPFFLPIPGREWNLLIYWVLVVCPGLVVAAQTFGLAQWLVARVPKESSTGQR